MGIRLDERVDGGLAQVRTPAGGFGTYWTVTVSGQKSKRPGSHWPAWWDVLEAKKRVSFADVLDVRPGSWRWDNGWCPGCGLWRMKWFTSHPPPPTGLGHSFGRHNRELRAIPAEFEEIKTRSCSANPDECRTSAHLHGGIDWADLR